MANTPHQYIRRDSGKICDERMFGDGVVHVLYHPLREHAPSLFRLLTGPRVSSLLARLNYDTPLNGQTKAFVREANIDLSETVLAPERLDTARKFFERQIRYWDCRPMNDVEDEVVSPADSRVLVGSLADDAPLFIKEKFFTLDELMACDKPQWVRAFQDGDCAIFRLTPDKYHYNHCPVAGRVQDFYAVEGAYHSCNPSAVVAAVTPYSKNKRHVTVIDTDVPGGTQVGLVAMIEVVALMIGEIVQCYCERGYDTPCAVTPGMFVRKGSPKSLYRPGSSTDVLLFQKDRMEFSPDLVSNQLRPGIMSRFSEGFGRSLIETDVQVRSPIGRARS